MVFKCSSLVLRQISAKYDRCYSPIQMRSTNRIIRAKYQQDHKSDSLQSKIFRLSAAETCINLCNMARGTACSGYMFRSLSSHDCIADFHLELVTVD